MTPRRALTTLLLFLLPAAFPGCARERCAPAPDGAIPAPAGSHLCAWQAAQAAAAEQDDFVLYQYEWQGNSPQLSEYGAHRFEHLARRMQVQPFPLLIEPSGDLILDDHRRNALIERATALGVDAAEMRVHVGRGLAEGLLGQEAPRLGRGYLQSGSGGGRGGGGIGGGGGFGAGGGGFGGGGGGGFGGTSSFGRGF